MQVKRISTEDGSDSLYVPEIDETYHSIHGAIQESAHVFIQNGLRYYLESHHPKQLDILEFGFGTGLNALLSLREMAMTRVAYTSLEKYPVNPTLAKELNYGKALGLEAEFERLITCQWGNWCNVTDGFKLMKREIDFVHFEPVNEYDIVYFDAFAPSKQPELWTMEILEKCHKALRPQGIFVTYSAKGQVRRDLQSLGFQVERLPGPPGKFEMLRALKG